ncbi:adenosylcobinamide-phosphate synthase CbiB [Lichenicoccus roseus]|uniref:Cobalamin biosynthesis protein CobD n=1 Tax=Lichenicoccus roseus TaxID=2683649 RepID=A0A5R9JAQ3_9PROT|nr:adenosylcobinamide-phosphate synthase CbiB [Lichenicoccus roseus]TLU73617.1 cobalamin biosynthesis protein CobD [Lichenicoccus roseus]
MVTTGLGIALAGLVIEGILGYPPPLFRLWRHPVVWIGALIGWLDRSLNRENLPQARRRLNGVLALLLVAGATALAGGLLQALALDLLPRTAGILLCGLVTSSLLAQRSLYSHVCAVADALQAEGLQGGRAAVSHIVGRDPASLDEPAVIRAAIESLAENFSDGVTAPLLWCALLGLPGIAAYKAINTADSMIGHLSERHRAFGWASARLDDWVNLPASRLAAAWIALASPRRLARCWRIVRRDARLHRSPNAGWPEAAMAASLGLRLAGPRDYASGRVDDPWIGDGDRPASLADLRRALVLYRRACALQLLVTAMPLALLAAA